ncbi:ABC transporter substrate-binding protein [Humibacter ginsengisoli]
MSRLFNDLRHGAALRRSSGSRRRFRAALAIAVAAGLCASLSGCVSGLASGYAANPHKITYLTWENSTTNGLLDKAFAGYESDGYTMQRLEVPASGFNQQISSLSLAQKLPDFFWCDPGMATTMGSEGLLFNWADWAKKNPKYFGFDATKFSPGTIDPYYVTKDKLYGIPTLANTYGVYYNKKYLAAAHIPVPSTTWTWDDLFADAAKMKGVLGSTYGINDMAYDTNTVNVRSVGAGGRPLSPHPINGKEFTPDEHFIQATEQFAQAFKAGDFTPPSGNAAANDTAAFASGKLGMMYGGQWLAVTFLQGNMKPSDWGWAPLPTGSVKVQINDPQGLCSPANVENPEETWKAISYLQTHVFPKVLPASPVAPPAYAPSAPSYYAALNKQGATSVSAGVKYVMGVKQKLIGYIGPATTPIANITNSTWLDILESKIPASTGVPGMFQQINQAIKENPSY